MDMVGISKIQGQGLQAVGPRLSSLFRLAGSSKAEKPVKPKLRVSL
jgi:hypothetical protein